MTVNYQESNVEGTSYVRCNQLVGFNPLGGNPSVQFSEEKIFTLGGQIVRQNFGGMTTMLTEDNAADTFAILDPLTGTPTGQTMSRGQFYAAVYSLYINEALARDAAQE